MIKIAIVILSTLLGALLASSVIKAVNQSPDFYANCSEARAHHDTNIPKSSKYYRVELDRNNNGYACE